MEEYIHTKIHTTTALIYSEFDKCVIYLMFTIVYFPWKLLYFVYFVPFYNHLLIFFIIVYYLGQENISTVALVILITVTLKAIDSYYCYIQYILLCVLYVIWFVSTYDMV